MITGLYSTRWIPMKIPVKDTGGLRAAGVKLGPALPHSLIPETAETHGHGTHTWAQFWKADLIELLARSGG